MLISKAHVTFRKMHETGAFTLRPLARKLGLEPSSLRYILSTTMPKVTVALALQRELGIPITDWEIPAEAQTAST
jgi:hypothetical protein